MASDYGTYRVFISSSMAELAEEREVVERVIHKAGYHPFVYERDAGARPWNHEETFVRELKAANLYVGIFWNKYGPYTIQEFDLAKERGIPILLFEKASSPTKREQRLQAFIDKQNKVTNPEWLTIARFSTSSDLREMFEKSFQGFLAEGAKRGWRARGVPGKNADAILARDLPCLCDRDLQEIHFEEQVASYFQTRSTRPLLLILPGPVEERHGLYLNRVKLCSLEEYLHKSGIQGGKKVIQIRKSPCAMTSPAHIRNEILGLLQEHETGDDKVIVDHVRRTRLNALVIVVRVLASECKGNPQKSLELIADYLAAFPDTKEDVLVTMVVCLEEDRGLPKSQEWWNRVFGGSVKPVLGLFDKTVLEIQQRYQAGVKLRIETLPPLASPKVVDVRRWLDHDLVKSSLLYVPEKEIEAMFQGRDSLSMDDLYLKLTDLLEKRTA